MNGPKSCCFIAANFIHYSIAFLFRFRLEMTMMTISNFIVYGECVASARAVAIQTQCSAQTKFDWHLNFHTLMHVMCVRLTFFFLFLAKHTCSHVSHEKIRRAAIFPKCFLFFFFVVVLTICDGGGDDSAMNIEHNIHLFAFSPCPFGSVHMHHGPEVLVSCQIKNRIVSNWIFLSHHCVSTRFGEISFGQHNHNSAQ